MPPTKPKPAAKPKRRVPVETIRHRKDKRVNIPTRELRDFMADDEAKPKTKTSDGLLYARDPSLDPQLVWKGKDDQDRKPLEVPVVPIYIQEKIHPQAIVEAIKAHSAKDEPALPTLFSDFNGIKFEEMVDFYHHAQNWSNRMILGDSLMVMTSLAEKEGLKGKVQAIYLDPPYGIKFGSNWQVSTRKRDVKDGKVDDLTRQPEQIRAFRDTWELGIHSYLSYLRDRLVVARELLTESGSVFVQIGDENVHLVRCLMDEVFGAENFVSLVSFQTTTGLGDQFLDASCNFLIWYCRDKARLKYRELFSPKGLAEDVGERYRRIQLSNCDRRPMTTDERSDPTALPRGASIYRNDNLTSQSGGDKSAFIVDYAGQSFSPGRGFWKTNEIGMRRLLRADRVASPTPNSIQYVRFLDDFAVSKFSNVWTDTRTGAFTDDKTSYKPTQRSSNAASS